MTKKNGIIWDFDNTLVATYRFIIDHLAKTCQRLKTVSPSPETIIAVLQKNPPFEGIFSELFDKNGAEILAAYRETAMDTSYQATEGGVEFVRKQVALGGIMIIVSNRNNKLEERLVQAGYDPKSFLSILKAEPSKPDQHAYDQAIALLSGKEIIVIGDHTDDYLACPDDLRSNFIAVTTGLTTAEEFEKVGVTKDKIWPSLKHQNLLTN